MLVSGEIENVPLLEVVQVVSFSKQTGVLTVEGPSIQGSILFENGGVVCAESTSTRSLLARASLEPDGRTRHALTRVSALAALTELLSLRKGLFRFKNTKERPDELAEASTRWFYEAGPMDTGELLLILANAIDKKKAPAPAPATARTPRQKERSHPRFAPTVIPAVVELGTARLEGHITNLSAGGGFLQADVLPPEGTSFRLRLTLPGGLGEVSVEARVAWVRADGQGGPVGAGIAFRDMSASARASLEACLNRYQALASRVGAGA